MIKFLTGAAALALVASAVSADPGGGKGGGQGKGGGGNDHAGHAMTAPGGGSGKGHGGGQVARDNRGNGGEARGNKGRGGDDGVREARGNGRGNGNEMRGPGRGQDDRVREARGNGRGNDDRVREARGNGRGNDDRVREARGNGRGKDDGMIRVRDDDRIRAVRNDRGGFDWDDAIPARARGLVQGCPPGLAKKNNGCMPPGLARAAAPALFYNSPQWWDFDRDWYSGVNWNDDYRYYDGYLVRYGDSGIDGWIPLLGGALSPGNVWPSFYDPVALPDYYQDYYGLGSPDSYRYYDDALYQVDPRTDMITTIAGLLTGDNFAVGQPMPLGYDVYNVPYSYRDQYVDGPDAYYRYSDGYVYQVDPTTQLVQAAIQLLT